ncbi:hypothetical protein CXU21_11280 [Akkermansia muciniphila]|nr:hypothetical protein CXU21_11280 [Akkermansia muciniphila]
MISAWYPPGPASHVFFQISQQSFVYFAVDTTGSLMLHDIMQHENQSGIIINRNILRILKGNLHINDNGFFPFNGKTGYLPHNISEDLCIKFKFHKNQG